MTLSKNTPREVIKFLKTQWSYFFWINKHVISYYWKHIRTFADFWKYYNVLLLFSLLVLPWLTKLITFSLITDFLTYFSFIILLKDKIEAEADLQDVLSKAQTQLEEELTNIAKFSRKYDLEPTSEALPSIVLEEIQQLRNYRYFDDNRGWYIQLLIREMYLGKLNEHQIFAFTYLYFNEANTKFRAQFIQKFDKKLAYRKVTKEYYLLQCLHNLDGKVAPFPPPDNKLSILAPERIGQLIALELGEQITKENIERIISDRDFYKGLQKLIIHGLNEGIISDASIESIVRNENRLLFIIKYGEGTSLKDWPRATEKAPFAKLLKSENFKNPFDNDYYTFIRDLSAHPLDTDPESYIVKLLRKHTRNYSDLKKKYPKSTAIQKGPHYGLIAFIMEKHSFIWKLSPTRDFNSFLNRLLVDRVLQSEMNQEFLQANYHRVKKFIDSMHWNALIESDQLRADLRTNNKNIEKFCQKQDFALKTLRDFAMLSAQQREALTVHLTQLLAGQLYGKKKSAKARATYMRTAVTKAANESHLFVRALDGLTTKD